MRCLFSVVYFIQSSRMHQAVLLHKENPQKKTKLLSSAALPPPTPPTPKLCPIFIKDSQVNSRLFSLLKRNSKCPHS